MTNDRGSTQWYFLKNDIGLDFIAELYANNSYGHMLTSTGDLEVVLKVMRFSIVLGNVNSSLSFDDIFGMDSPQHLPNQIKMLKHDESRLDSIMSCSIDAKTGCKADFKHMMTNKGICNVYNGVDPSLIYNESPHLNLFSKLFNIERQKMTFKTQIFGPRSSLHVILDNHRSEVFGTESGSFTLAFSHANSSFDALTNSLELLPGMFVLLNGVAYSQGISTRIRGVFRLSLRRLTSRGRLMYFRARVHRNRSVEGCALRVYIYIHNRRSYYSPPLDRNACGAKAASEQRKGARIFLVSFFSA